MEKNQKGQGFDLVTHVRNPKTGMIEKKQPYRLKFVGGTIIYVRDGKNYSPNGEELLTKEEKQIRVKESAIDKAKRTMDNARLEQKRCEKANTEALTIEIDMDDQKEILADIKDKKSPSYLETVEKIKVLEQKWKEAENKHIALKQSSENLLKEAQRLAEEARGI